MQRNYKEEMNMSAQCMMSNVAKNYLSEFYCILDRMICEMNEAELSDSISGNFIAQMIPHHKAAVEMSKNILKYTTLMPLQCIAENIIKAQTKGIEEMSEMKCKCEELCSSKCDLCLYQRNMNAIFRDMFNGMKAAHSDNCINCNFMREMIPHHMGAVRMADNALRYTVCKSLVPVLEGIIAEQRRGIVEMRELMRKIGCRS